MQPITSTWNTQVNALSAHVNYWYSKHRSMHPEKLKTTVQIFSPSYSISMITSSTWLPWLTHHSQEVYHQVLLARYQHQNVCAATPETGHENVAIYAHTYTHKHACIACNTVTSVLSRNQINVDLSSGFTSQSTQNRSFRRRSCGKTKPNITKAHIHQSNEMYYHTK